MTSLKKLILLLVIIPQSLALWSQIVNDECFTALSINDLNEFCFDGYSNVGAVNSGIESPACWNNGAEESDFWIHFSPRNPGLLLRFFGSGNNSAFTIDNVSLALYEGNCSRLNEIDCIRRNQGADDIFERVYTDLTIGGNYYLRISSTTEDAGTFQLCLSEFVPIPEPQQDCNLGVVLCDKASFVVEKIEGVGLIPDEAAGSCLDGLGPGSPPTQLPDVTETSSVWYRWTAATSGTLTLTIVPNNDDSEEDIDFAIYRLPLGINDCTGKELLRCMASGAPNPNDDICLGPTGLREGENDIVEYVNCEQGSNNFLAPLDMIAGESYVMIVNNFSNSGFGFSVEFGGTGDFLGPIADFSFTAIDDFSCDKTITFENQSNSMTDEIVDYNWRFGEGSVPQVATGPGPHDVVYESFGPKVAVLRVETVRGCQVTKVLDLQVDPCCNAQNQLTLIPQVEDATCFESADGIIRAVADNGTPDYLFALNDNPLNPRSVFTGLTAGNYMIDVLDRKGCMASTVVSIDQPVPIELFITGPTDTIDLGSSAQLFSDFSPADRNLMYSWSPPDGLSCTDCPNPEVLPPGTTTYTLTVTDQDGCQQEEEFVIYTTDFKPFYAPNIISLSSSNPRNGLFRVFSNIAADVIESVVVFDRWGNELYREEFIDFEDSSYRGWDGRVVGNNRKVNPGVYVWQVKLRFVDGIVRTFVGDLTVID